MWDPVYVTDVKPRVRRRNEGISVHVVFLDQEMDELYASIGDRKEFTFPNIQSPGLSAYHRLMQFIRDLDREGAIEALEVMKQHRIESEDELTDAETWGKVAMQLPGDWGPIGEHRLELKRLLTQKAKGRVLEAMCGFTSYFLDSPDINEVVAMDFCREELELYDHPERQRILFDMNLVVNGGKIDFFPDGSFDTIGVCFGTEYFKDMVPIYHEFFRLCCDNGNVLIAGGTTQGLRGMIKEWFNPEKTAERLKRVGFDVDVQELPYKTKSDRGSYFLVEGRKN
ncbi:MAG: class I SAM-dependent methyltransferase [Candidatus Woesearchaeota archaeon]|nr:class I SAM-dependent methyltransferase [Candidatus Woesearchaeota archaeon]MDP7458463.1 class I SAM-dependent methyltransferase [Candidatus Woesearchaeota archaeon]